MEEGVLCVSGFLQIGLNFYPNILIHRSNSIINKIGYGKKDSNQQKMKGKETGYEE